MIRVCLLYALTNISTGSSALAHSKLVRFTEHSTQQQNKHSSAHTHTCIHTHTHTQTSQIKGRKQNYCLNCLNHMFGYLKSWISWYCIQLVVNNMNGLSGSQSLSLVLIHLHPTPNPTKLHKHSKFKDRKETEQQYKPGRNLKPLQLQTLNHLPSESSPEMHYDSAFYDA